jgi:hypothetical protein
MFGENPRGGRRSFWSDAIRELTSSSFDNLNKEDNEPSEEDAEQMKNEILAFEFSKSLLSDDELRTIHILCSGIKNNYLKDEDMRARVLQSDERTKMIGFIKEVVEKLSSQKHSKQIKRIYSAIEII